MNDSLNQSINQLINDEGVCRTSPATPGLLKILGFIQSGQVKIIVFFFTEIKFVLAKLHLNSKIGGFSKTDIKAF